MEIRKDYLLNRWTFISEERIKRPMDFHKERIKKKNQCFFCPGKEDSTPSETGRREKNGKWIIRWFPNKFPVVWDTPLVTMSRGFLVEMTPSGYHEVIVEARAHTQQLWDLPVGHIKTLLDVYAERISELKKKKNVKYVAVFKNHSSLAGTSLVHSHSQVVALPILPDHIREELKASQRYSYCPHCRILRMERKSQRRCFENKSMVAFTPYAPRFNYEIKIFPKRHIRSLAEMREKERMDFARILKKVLLKLRKRNMPYNFFLHHSPDGKDLHFHMSITPRLGKFGGVELSTDAVIISDSPEEAARYYRH